MIVPLVFSDVSGFVLLKLVITFLTPLLLSIPEINALRIALNMWTGSSKDFKSSNSSISVK